VIHRRRARTAIATGLAVLVAAALAGCGGDKQKSFSTPTYPFSFEHPSGWTVKKNAEFTYGSAGAGERSVSVEMKVPYDQVTITQYKLKKTLPAGINGNQKEIDGIVKRLTRQANGSASDAKIVSFGGIPGYQYIVEYPAQNGAPLQNRLTFLFKGNNEFQINCQSTEKSRSELNKGCDKVLGSLKFT
jgi:hypothetical protein